MNLNGDFYETVTVKVPKLVMDFLRKIEDKPIESLEYSIVNGVRAQIEGMTSMEWSELFKLQPIFASFLDDSRYKKNPEN